MKTARADEVLRGVLRAAIDGAPDAAGGVGSVPCRASAALYFLLIDHSVDHQGRCRLCRRPGAAFGLRPRLCRVHMKAEFWLQQPTEFLRSTFVRGLRVTDLPPSRARATGDFGDTDLLPCAQPCQTLAVRSPGIPGATADPTHGGAGVHPTASGSAVSQSTGTGAWRGGAVQ